MSKRRIFIGLCLFIVFFSMLSVVSATGDAVENSTLATANDDLNTISVANNQEDQLGDPVGTFLDLELLIDETPDNGSISLEGDYTYFTGDTGVSDGIVIDKNITIDGKGYTIDAKNTVSIFNIQGNSKVVLKNINFVNAKGTNGGAIKLDPSTHLEIINCNFTNNEALTAGGAIYVYNSTSVTSNLTITDSNFINNSASFGGAVYMNENSHDISLIENSKFINCTSSGDGGAVYVTADNVEFKNVLFEDNVAGDDGGAIYWEGNNGVMYNITCINNRGVSANKTDGTTSSTRGGTICLTGDNVTITDSMFISSSAYMDEGKDTSKVDGGAIFLTGNDVTITNTIFSGCNATNSGGALYVLGNDTHITSCTFTSNTGSDAGALYVNGTNCILVDSIFTDNIVGDDGGAIYWAGDDGIIYNITCTNNKGISANKTDGSTSSTRGGTICLVGSNVTVTKSTFTLGSAYMDEGKNASKVDGGALFVTGNDVTITDNVFNKCNSTNAGGAIYIIGNETHIINCTFNECASKDGAALYVDGKSCTLFNSTFTDNVAGDDGGAIFWQGDNGYMYNITCANNKGISYNTSSSRGGSICLTGDNVTVAKSKFSSSNVYIDAGDSSKVDGGALFITGNNVTIYETEFTDCSAVNFGGAIYVLGDDTQILNCSLRETTALVGGGIFIAGNGAVVDDSLFRYNTAAGPAGGSGGAVYVEGNDATISNSDFAFNNVINYGGAISVWGQNANITKNVFDNCSTTLYDGGAIYVNGANTTISLSNFTRSRANNDYAHGGAIQVSGNDATIEECNFEECYAFYGGIIHVSGSNTKINNSNFKESTAFDGGAIYVDGANSNIVDSNFSDLTSERFGGAIFVSGTDAIINSSSFEDIKSDQGGAIYISGSNALVYTSTFKDTTADRGGAIYVFGTYATILQSNFTDILADSNGGAIFVAGSNANISESVFTSCDAKKYHGGAIYVEGADTTIEKSNFTLCEGLSKVAQGGAIYIYGANTLINDSSFDRCKAIEGGDIYVFGNHAVIEGSEFNSSTANKGGAIYLYAWGAIVRTSHISDCNASTDGGAIYVDGGGVYILESYFDDCMAKGESSSQGGGAIYVEGPDSHIANSTFNNNRINKGSARGGAVYIKGEGTFIEDSDFNNSFAHQGGVVYIEGENAIVNSSSFANSSSTSFGGAIAVYGHNATIEWSTFDNIQANDHGGAIYVHGEETKILQSSFDYCTVNGNNKMGGAIYIYDMGTTVAFSNFTHSKAITGGAIYINGKNTTISYCNLHNNTASSAGAIKVFGNDTLLSNCNFTYNTASGDGGALDIGGSNASVFYSWFDHNEAGSKGGAINWLGGHGDDSISGSNFTNNRCNDTKAGGGAIYWTAAAVIASGGLIQNSIFINNTAVHHGGAIDWFQAKDSTINNCLFINNTAYGDGGALYTGDQGGHGHHLMMSNCQFYTNTAMKHGGAIANQMSDSWIYNNTFDGNNAMASAGTILMKEKHADNSVIDHCYIYNSFVNHTYSGNDYGVGGGAIRIGHEKDAGDSNITISNCAIINSTVNQTWGGAILIDAGSKGSSLINVTIQNARVLDGYGGAICWKGSDGTMNNVTIFNSSSTLVTDNIQYKTFAKSANGGAIYISASNCNLNDIHIFTSSTNNNNSQLTKDSLGGAVYISGSSNTITNIEIDEASALSARMDTKGGAIYWAGQKGTLINATISNTLANGQGGAIYWSGSSPVAVENISISYPQTFVNSTKNADGGAIYTTTVSKLKNVYVIDAIAATTSGDIHGGAIYFTGTTLDNITVIGSRATTDNGISYGGAVYLPSGSKTYIYNSSFMENTADLGGALVNDRDVSIKDTGFFGNVAEDGGAIYTQKGNLALTNVTLFLNSAKRGGAIFVENVLFEIADSNLRNNTAEGKGGAIYYISTKSSSIKNTDLINNTAFQGSAIYTSKFFTLKDVVLLDNQANSNKFIDKHVGVDEQGRNYTSAVFVGFDNVLNAIWCEEELITVACNNVTYWSANGRNVSNTIPTRKDKEAGINVTVEMYNGNGEQVNTSRLVTDEEGRVKYIFDYHYGDTVYFAYVHDSDRYYTSLRDTMSNSSLVKLYVIDPLYYGQNQTIRVDLGDGAWGKLSGNVTVRINDTKHSVFEIEVINGTYYIENLTGWTLGQYNVSAVFLGDTNHTGDTDWVLFTVLPYTDVGVTKGVNITADYVNVTDVIKYTIDVTNYGPSNATGVNVTEKLSPYLKMLENTTTHGHYNLTNGYWYIGDLEVNETATLTIVGEVIHVGPITNTVWVRSDGRDINETNDNSTAHNFTALPIVDLRIVKKINTTSYTINVTDVIKYNITVYNYGPCNATGVVVGEVIDPHLHILSNTTTVGRFENGTWNIGYLANGTNATLIITALVAYSGNITNAVNVTCFENDTNMSNNFANVTNLAIAYVDLQINKTVNATGTVNVTDKIKFTITIYNAGPANASGVYVSEILNRHIRMISHNETIGEYDGATWVIGALNVGEVHNLTIIAEVISAGNITNEVNITSVDNDTNLTNNHDNITNITAQPIVDLVITKRANTVGSVNVSDLILFTISVHNNGPCDATNVNVTEKLSDLLEIVDNGISVTQGTYNATTGIWDIGNMANQSTVELAIGVRVIANGTIANVVVVNSTEIDTNESNNRDNITNITAYPIVDLGITKEVNVTSSFVNVSDRIKFTITVHNNGPSNATNVNVTEDLGPYLKMLTNQTQHGYYNVTEGVWHIGNLSNQSTAVLTLECEVSGNGTIVNVVSVNSTERDTYLANNTAGLTLVALPIVDVSINKTVNVTTGVVNIGDKIEFNITVHNAGPSNATGVYVGEILDGHLRLVSNSTTRGEWDGSTWVIGKLNKGETVNLTIIAQVFYAGNITNEVIVYSTENDTNLTNNKDNISAIKVSTSVDLEINKTINVTKVNVTDIIKFTITVHNKSPNNASGVYVSEYLDPTIYEFISSNATHGQYDGTFTWNIGFLNSRDTANLTIVARIINVGNFTNTVKVNAVNDTNESNDKAEVNFTSLPIVDLQITKVVDFGAGTVNVGQSVQFTITVKNNGPWTATNVSVNETLSPLLKMTSHINGTGVYNVTSGIWYIGDMTNQSTAQLIILAKVISNGTIANAVVVTGNETDTNMSNNNDTIDNITALPLVDLNITKSVNRTVLNVTDLIEFIIVVHNNGPCNATKVNVTEVLDSRLKMTNNITDTGYYNVTEGIWHIGNLNNQSNATLKLICEVTGDGWIDNYVEVSSYENETSPWDNWDRVSFTALPIVDLAITKKVNVTTGYVNVTDLIEFNITVKNNGPSNATSVLVAEILDSHYLKLISNTTTAGSYDGFSWNIPQLNNQSSATLTIVARVISVGNFTNAVNVTCYQNDTNMSNNKANITNITALPIVDLAIEKEANTTGPVNVSDRIKFTITVKNNGPWDATKVNVTEKLSDHLKMITNETADGYYNVTTGIWYIGDMVNQSTAVLTIVAEVISVGNISNAVVVSSFENDTNMSNNNDSIVNITVLPIVDVQITKKVNVSGNVSVTDLIKFTITVFNAGPYNATNVNVSEILNPHLKLIKNETADGYYNATTGIWHIGNLNNQSTAVLYITARIISSGIITNVVVASSTEKDSNLTNNRDQIEYLRAFPIVDLEITKTANVSVVNVSGLIEFNITVTNRGPCDAEGVYVGEILDSHLKVVSNSTTVGRWDGFTWIIGKMANQSNATLTIVAKVVLPGNVTNFVSVNGTERDTNTSNNNFTIDNITALPIVDLQITKYNDFNSSLVTVGDSVQFTISVKNNGPCDATNVTVVEVLSPHLEMTGNWTWMGYYNVTEGIWHIGNLANQSEVNLTIQAKVISNGIISNVVVVKSHENDTNISNNKDAIDNITALPLVDLNITKEINATVISVYDLIKFTIIVHNNGPCNATWVNVTEKLDSRLRMINNITNNGYYNVTEGIWHIGDLNNGSNATLTLECKVLGEGAIDNYVEVSSFENETSPWDNWFRLNFNVLPVVDLVIAKTVNTTGPVNVTDLIEFNITVHNNGPSNATGVLVGEILDSHLKIISNSTEYGTYDGFTWNIGNLTNQSTAVLTIVAQVVSDGNISNSVNVTSYQNDTNKSNNKANITNITALPVVDLEIAKVVDFGSGTVEIGDLVQFTITVHNNGPCDATNITVVEVLSPLLEMVGNWTFEGYYNVTEGIWHIGNLANQSTAKLTIQAKIISNGTITNVVVVSSNETDTNKSNNNDTIDNITALPIVDLNITKIVNPAVVNITDLVEFKIIVYNNGPCNATKVNVSEALGSKLKMISNVTANGYYNVTEGIWHIGNMNNGSNATLTLVCEVLDDGFIDNYVEVSSYEKEITPWDNWDKVTFTALPLVDLAITKEANVSGFVNVSDLIKFTVTVINNGPSNATSILVSEILDKHLKLISNTTTAGKYDGFTWNIERLNNQSNATLTIIAQVIAVGNITNEVAVDCYQNDTNESNNKANITNITALPVVDLAVIKEVNVSGAVNVTDKIKFTITVHNNGPCNATGVNVTEILNSNLKMLSNETDYGYYSIDDGVWYIGNLNNQSTAVLTIIARVISAGNISNAVAVKSNENDTNKSNNNDTIDNITALPIVDLAVTKEVNVTTGIVNVTDKIKFTITVHNNGPCNATGVNVSEVLNSNLKMLSNETDYGYYSVDDGVWYIGTLNNQSTAVLTIIAEVISSGNITNAVVVESNGNDTNKSDNNDTIDNITAVDIVDLVIIKDVNVSDVVYVGDLIRFTITVHNNGPCNATGVNVSEVLNSNLKMVSNATDYGYYSLDDGVWYVGTLNNQSTAVLTIVAQVISSGNITNAVVVVSNENDTNKSNNNDTIDNITALNVVDLAIIKDVNVSDVVYVGDLIRFTITVHNNGPCNATGVNVSEVLNSNLKMVSNATDYGYYSLDDGVWYVGTLNNQSTAVLTIVAQVISSGNITNAVVVESNENDTNKSNNNDTIDNITALNVVDLAIIKEVNVSDVVYVGDLIRFTITVHNNGPCNATGVNVSEVLNSNLKMLSNETDYGYYSLDDGVWYVGTLNNQSTAVLTIVAQVISSGNITNAVVVESNENDTNKSNNNDTIDNITALNVVDLAIIKEVNVSGVVNVTDFIRFTITVHNNGPCNATGVNVSEVLNSNLKMVSNVTDYGYYSLDDGVWYIGDLNNQSTAILTIVVQVISNGTISNVVIVESNENDTNMSNNNDTIDNITALPIVDVKVNKTVDVTRAFIGDNITYTIVVQNNGPSDATDVKVLENMSDKVSFVKFNATQGNYDAIKNIWYIGKLSNGSIATLTLTVKVVDVGIIRNSVIVKPKENDTNMTNNNYTSDDVTVEKLDTPIDLITYNITYGEDEVLVVRLPSNATGTVNITVGNRTYSGVAINNGIVELPVSDLAGGNYTVDVVYGGDNRYMPNSTSGKFNVARVVPIITIEVEDIWVGEVEILNVTVNAPGIVFVTVYGITVEISLDNGVVTTDVLAAIAKTDYKGNATWNILNLPAGPYPAFALYPGNENYTSVNTSDLFHVRDIPTTVVVSADDIHVGEDAVISIHVGPEGVYGNVTVVLDDRKYVLAIDSYGDATLIVPGLAAGQKEVYVYYNGTQLYRPSENSTEFKVLKLKPPVDIDSPEITVGEDGVITVTVPDDATGTITIEIDGKRYTEPIENGQAVFIIPGLKAGKHNITAFYSGDDKYLPSNSTGVIKVNPKDEPIHHNDTPIKSTIENKMHETGNPVMALIFVIMSLSLVPLRRLKK